MKDSLKERILACRYYNGEETEPKFEEPGQGTLWFYEKFWATSDYKCDWSCEKEDMKHLGLDKALSKLDIPDSLKCLLFNRYAHWSGIHENITDEFVAWVKEHYACRPTNKTQQHRILDCRYYNGEAEPPSSTDGLWWDYERIWVTDSRGSKAYKFEIQALAEMGALEELKNDGTPIGILAILFNRYLHWIGHETCESFARWIREGYDMKPTHRKIRKAKRIPELIARCQFYHGEKECPYTDKREAEYWKYESIWVEEMSDSYTNAKIQIDILHHFPKIEAFVVKRKLPRSLIGLLINREEHWTGYIASEDKYIDGLKRYYLKDL